MNLNSKKKYITYSKKSTNTKKKTNTKKLTNTKNLTNTKKKLNSHKTKNTNSKYGSGPRRPPKEDERPTKKKNDLPVKHRSMKTKEEQTRLDKERKSYLQRLSKMGAKPVPNPMHGTKTATRFEMPKYTSEPRVYRGFMLTSMRPDIIVAPNPDGTGLSIAKPYLPGGIEEGINRDSHALAYQATLHDLAAKKRAKDLRRAAWDRRNESFLGRMANRYLHKDPRLSPEPTPDPLIHIAQYHNGSLIQNEGSSPSSWIAEDSYLHQQQRLERASERASEREREREIQNSVRREREEAERLETQRVQRMNAEIEDQIARGLWSDRQIREYRDSLFHGGRRRKRKK